MKPAPVDRYILADELNALAEGWDRHLDEETLDKLTHHVADVLDADVPVFWMKKENA